MSGKFKAWLFGDEISYDISSIQKWDIDTSEFVYYLFSKRYDDEKTIAKSFKTRAIFLLGALGVTLTLIFTTVGSNITAISEWSEGQQIVFILILFSFAIAIALYFYLYNKLDCPEYLQLYPDNKLIDVITKNERLSKKELLNNSIIQLYSGILKASRENNRIYLFFRIGDFIFMTGIIIAVFYSLVVASLSLTAYFVVFTIILIVIYFVMIWRILVELPQAIRNLRYLKNKYLELRALKKKVKEQELSEKLKNRSSNNLEEISIESNKNE